MNIFQKSNKLLIGSVVFNLVIKYSFGQSREIRSAELCKRGNYWFCGQQLSDLIRKFEDKYRFVKSKLLFLFLIYVALGCKKDNYQSKPELTLKNFKVIPVSGGNVKKNIIEIELEVKDKEGDVSDSIFIQKIILEPGLCIDTLTLSKMIPSFPASGNTQKITFLIKFASFGVSGFNGDQLLPGRCSDEDLTVFKIVAKDKGGNYSDTLTTPSAIIQ